MVKKHVNKAGVLESCGSDPNNPNARGCPFGEDNHTTATEPAAQKKFAESVNTLRSLEENGVGRVRSMSKGPVTTSKSVHRLLVADAANKAELYNQDRNYVDSKLKPQIHDNLEMYSRELNQDIDYESLSAAEADDLHNKLREEALYKRQNKVTDGQRRTLHALEKESGKSLDIDYSKMNYQKANNLISELNLSEDVQKTRRENPRPKAQHVPRQDIMAEERKKSTKPLSDAQKAQVISLSERLGRKVDTDNMTTGDYWTMIDDLQQEHAKSTKETLGKYR